MSLHLVFSPKSMQACQQRCLAEDVIVLLGDGVYAMPMSNTSADVFMLEPDCVMRGVKERGHAQLISYAELVDLTVAHTPVVSWNN